MPVRTDVFPERELVVTTGTGVVTDHDFQQAREELVAQASFQPTFDRIWDFSGVTQVNLSDSAISHLVTTSPTANRVWRAVVCTEPATVDRVREFVAASRALGREIAIFPTRGDAEQWIESQRANPPDFS